MCLFFLKGPTLLGDICLLWYFTYFCPSSQYCLLWEYYKSLYKLTPDKQQMQPYLKEQNETEQNKTKSLSLQHPLAFSSSLQNF